MLTNVLKIFYYEFLQLAKRRFFVLFFSIFNSCFALFVLLFTNNIFIHANIDGTVDYNRILFLYNIVWNIIFIIIFLVITLTTSTYFNSINNKENLTHILSTNIMLMDLFLGVLFSRMIIYFTLFMSFLPLILITIFFGGISFYNIFLYSLFLFISIFLFCNICIYLSSSLKNETISLFISCLIGIFYLIFMIFFNYIFIHNILYFLLYFVFCIVLSLVFLFFSKKNYYKYKILNLTKYI